MLTFDYQIVGFGFTADQSLLLSCPAGAVAVITLVGCGYLGDRYSNRILYNSLGLVVAIVGILLILALPLSNKGGRLAGYYLMYACSPPFTALLSLISTNVAGHTKKTTVAAIYLIAYCAGLIIGT
jgi:ACS family allantoate permease-like MFS transporter